MPRKPRIEYAGAAYHVMCRGDRREKIFFEDEDRRLFLKTLGQVCERSGWWIHAYVLMPNHYHLLLETPEANLVAGMRWFQGTFTSRMNARHRLSGHLFQGRYKALLVDPGQRGYFLQVANYIHLNPVRARLVKPQEEGLESFSWSSYPQYLVSPRKRDAFLRTERVLGELGVEDTVKGRRMYRESMDEFCTELLSRRERKAWDTEWKSIRRGWCLGSEDFRQKMEDLVDGALQGKRRKSFSGTSMVGHDQRRADQLIRVGSQTVGLEEAELGGLPKLDERKQVLAWWVRKQTVVGNRWLADRLHMGDEGNLSKASKWVDESRDRTIQRLKKRLEKCAIPESED